MNSEPDKSFKNDSLIVRLEQLYPFPEQQVADLITAHKNAKLLWCQEEPQNMGAWSFVAPLIKNIANQDVKYVGRHKAASTATGYLKVHNKEQIDIIKTAFDF